MACIVIPGMSHDLNNAVTALGGRELGVAQFCFFLDLSLQVMVGVCGSGWGSATF